MVKFLHGLSVLIVWFGLGCGREVRGHLKCFFCKQGSIRGDWILEEAFHSSTRSF